MGVGPNPVRLCLSKREEIGHTDRYAQMEDGEKGNRTPREAEGRGRGDASTSQGTPKVASKSPEPRGEPWTDSSPSELQRERALLIPGSWTLEI